MARHPTELDSSAGGPKPVLLIAQEGSANLEVAVSEEAGVMIDLLSAAGYRVVVATKSGKPLVAKSRTITPDLTVDSVNSRDYAGLIMPCMNTSGSGITLQAIAITKEMGAAGKPIAAQRGSVPILGQAGILVGKRYSGWYACESQGTFTPNSVVTDGTIITSGGCPYSGASEGTIDGTRELTRLFIEALASG